MNRPLLIAAFALLVVAVPLSAQHGGGHAIGGHFGGGGFGGHGSFGGAGFAGHAGNTHAFSGARSGGFAGRSVAPRYYGRNSAFGRFGRNHSGVGFRFRSYPYGYNCWGGYCGYGGYYGYPYLGGGIDPYWWWDNGDNSDDSAADQPAPYGYDDGLANQMQQQGIPMRPAPNAGDQNYYPRIAPSTARQQQQPAQPSPATVLIFRDQHQEQVQNYAVVGQTFWNFTSGRTQKIPLSELDLPATQKANEAQGTEFRLPASSEGQ